MENRGKNLSAIDETVVKVNKKRYYVSLDVERNELILMRVYTARNYLTAKLFVRKELKYCENKVCC
jgi:putative transposase